MSGEDPDLVVASGERPTRVLVADDQPLTRWAVGHHLAQRGFAVVGELDDATALVDAARRAAPDVVVVETAMGRRGEALAAVVALGRHEPAARVLAFTADMSPVNVEAVLDSGCLGVVPKRATIEALVAAVAEVARGERHVHPLALAALLQRRHAAEAARHVQALSSRELDVVMLVAEGRTNGEIAEELGISETTVKTHVVHVLRKLGAVDRAHAVSRALRLGLFA